MVGHQSYEFIKAVVANKEITPNIATFENDYKAVVIIDAILKASASGKKQEIKYGELEPS